MQPDPVLENLNVLKDNLACLRPGSKPTPVNQFTFQRAEE